MSTVDVFPKLLATAPGQEIAYDLFLNILMALFITPLPGTLLQKAGGSCWNRKMMPASGESFPTGRPLRPSRKAEDLCRQFVREQCAFSSINRGLSQCHRCEGGSKSEA